MHFSAGSLDKLSEDIQMDKPASRFRQQTLGSHQLRPESLMMGYGYDPRLSEGALKCPLFQTSTFVFKTAEEGKAFFEVVYGLREKGPGEEPGLIYSRINNPDLQILEDRLTLWEGAEAALAFSSGMAAVSTTLLAFLRPGDTLLWSEPVYGATEYLIENILPGFGIVDAGLLGGKPHAVARPGPARSGPRLADRRDLRRDPHRPDEPPG